MSYTSILALLISSLAFGAEVRKLGANDLEWGVGTTTSPAGKVVTKIPAGAPDDNSFMGVHDVKAYGAAGDGTTEDTTAIQAALDDAHISGNPVFFPAGHYLTDTLNWKGQSLYGVGHSVPGAEDSGTIIRGKPGKDVFQVTDGSMDMKTNPYVRDMKIYVDATVDAKNSFSRTVNEIWDIGNAAFAIPWSDASDQTGNLNNATFSRITIEQYPLNDYNKMNSTAAFYFGTSPYSCTFDDIVVHMTEYGYINAPPSLPTFGMFAPDANLFNRITLTSKINFVVYGGSHAKINDMQIYSASGVNDKSFFLLTYISSDSTVNYPYHWVINGLYIENKGDSTGANSIIKGKQLVFVGGNLKQDGASNNYVQFDAHWSTMSNVGFGSDLDSSNPSLIINGNGNMVDISIWHTRQTVVMDNGVGNIIQFRNMIYDMPRIRGIYPHRPILYHQTGDWIESASAPYESKSDLVFHPEDINAGLSTTLLFDITKDTTVPISRAYLTIPDSSSTWTAAFFNGERADVGTRVPKTKARLYIRAKAGASVTHRLRVFYDTDTAGDATFSLTTSWATFSMPVDFSSAMDGDNFSLYGSDTSAPTDIDIAWVAIRPYADDIYSKGDLTISTIGKGVVMTNAAGTVTKRVRLNDSGDGLLYEDP